MVIEMVVRLVLVLAGGGVEFAKVVLGAEFAGADLGVGFSFDGGFVVIEGGDIDALLVVANRLIEVGAAAPGRAAAEVLMGEGETPFPLVVTTDGSRIGVL